MAAPASRVAASTGSIVPPRNVAGLRAARCRALGLLGLAVWAFAWAVNHGQFEDLDGAASSILFDEGPEGPPTGSNDPPERA